MQLAATMRDNQTMSHLILTSRMLPLLREAADRAQLGLFPLSRGGTIPENACALVTTASDPVPASVIEVLPRNVGLIANIGARTDHIDIGAAIARGLAVSATPLDAEDIADLTFALILAVCRKLHGNERLLRASEQFGRVPPKSVGMRVHGKTIGLIGVDTIAQGVARRATGFGMNILYQNSTRRSDLENQLGATFIEKIEDLLPLADIVSLHEPGPSTSPPLIDADRLALFKPGAVLINASRGDLVDETALVKALKSYQIASAGLDVFQNEVRPVPGLARLDQVVLTPQIGNATREHCQEMVDRCVANVVAFVETGRPLDPVTGSAQVGS